MTRRRPISLERSLFRNLVLGPVLLGALLLAFSLLANRAVMRSVASDLTGRAIAEIDAALSAYLRPVDEIVDLSLQLGRAGTFESMTEEELETALAAFLHAVTQISSIHVADEEGREFMLLQDSDETYFSRIFDPEDAGFITTRMWQPSADGADAGSVPERVESDYDTRSRVWFQQALAAKEEDESRAKGARYEAVWSDPYQFFTTGEPGITASIAFETPSGEREVLAFDILLREILDFVEASQVRESGIVFVLLRAGNENLVLAVPPHGLAEEFDANDLPFPVPTEEMGPAPQALIEHVFSVEGPSQGTPTRFETGNRTWWGAAARSPLSSDKELWIGATIPESEILSEIPDTRLMVLLGMLITVALMVFRAHRLAQRYGTPIADLVAQTDRMGRLNFMRSKTIESPILEIEALAVAQDELRTSLAALTKMSEREGMARELRALPSHMEIARCGPWELASHDDVAQTVGGTLVGMHGVREEQGRWLNADSESTGLAAWLASTRLTGMDAARGALQLRSSVEGMLSRPWSSVESVVGAAEQLHHPATLSRPFPVLALFVRRDKEAVQVAGVGKTLGLHWRSKEKSWHWFDDWGNEEGTKTWTQVLDLAEGDRLMVMPESLLDLVDEQRRRLTHDQIESWLATEVTGSAQRVAEVLGVAFRSFSAAGALDTDITLLVLGREGSLFEGSNSDSR